MIESNNQSQPEGFFYDLSEVKQHIIVLAILFIIPLITFSGTTLGKKQVLGSDTIQWNAANESLVEYRENHEDKEALWASNMFSGMPAYVISQPGQVPNIDNLLKRISKFLYPVVWFWVLLSGCYLFFILLKFDPLSAAIGSIFIAFTTYIPVIIEAGHVTKFISYSFIPWVLSGYVLITRSDKKLLAFFVFALALTLETRANHPQVLYYFLYLLFFWWVFDTYKAYKKEEIKSWVLTSIFIGVAGLLAVLSNLENYWSLYEYTQFSTRGGSSSLSTGQGTGLNLDYAFSWSQGWGELFTLIIPGIFGGSSGEAYWGPKAFTSGPHYFGAISFLLALFGVIRSKNKLKYLFLGVGILTTLFSLGKFFPLLNEAMFNVVPLFSKFRTPEMWLIVTVFCFSVLAVFGINEIVAIAKVKAISVKEKYLPIGIAATIALIFVFGATSFLSFEKPGEVELIAQQNNVSANNPQVKRQIDQMIETRIKPDRIEMAKSDSIRFFVLIFLASGLVVAFCTGKIGKEVFLISIFILGTYDMTSIAKRYMNEEKFVNDNITADQLITQQKRPLDDFIIDNINSDEGYPYRVFPLLDNPFNNAIPSYHYPSLGGYTAAKLSYYQDMIDNLLFTGNYGINTYMLSVLNTKYISINRPINIPSFKEVFSNNDNFVFENTEVLPKAYFADSVSTAQSPEDAIQQLLSVSNSNSLKTAIVEASGVASVESDTSSSVSVTQYDVQHIILETQSEQPQFLVLSEVYYPKGWKAFINGTPTEIFKTNYVLRGIEVPAGKHTIEFVFEPISSVLGSRISWFGTITIYLIGFLSLFGYIRKNHLTQESVA